MHLPRFAALTAALITLLAGAAQAAPQRYALETAASRVGFTYQLQGSPAQGTMPVLAADLMLDFDRAALSRFDVTLDAAHADAGVFFATDAMRGADILDTAHFPTIRFVTTRVRPDGAGAIVEGDVTIRGVTRPVVLKAELYRQKGTETGDRRALTVVLTGAVDRRDFGATGYQGLVGDRIALKILARIRQTD